MKYSFTPVSSNRKVGPIPVTYSSAETCPTTCPLRGNGCYAEMGPGFAHWKRLTAGTRGMDWPDLMKKIEAIPPKQLWRFNVAGDLPPDGDSIDYAKMADLLIANGKSRGFTYTHHAMWNPRNQNVVESMNAAGFTINLSANNLEHADELMALGIAPVVVLLPSDAPNTLTTPGGHAVVACPAEHIDNMSCATCGACAVATRKSIIGFHAHGSRKKKVNMIARFT